ncbi:hypothetical protein ACFQZC_18735 [Streptacidiphilus monticola]
MQEEETPQAVDHRGHRRHQVHQRDQPAAQPRRRDLGDEQGRAEGQRHRDADGHRRDQQGSGEHGGDAEVVDVRLPLLGGQEPEAGDLERLRGAQQQEQADGRHDAEHGDSGAAQHAAEHAVAPADQVGQLAGASTGSGTAEPSGMVNVPWFLP